MGWIIGLVSLATVAGAGLYHFRDLYFANAFLLPRDNHLVHFYLFQYVVAHMKFLHEIPDWNYHYGIALPPFANNHGLLAPHRLVGYFLFVFGGTTSNVAYKLSMLAGNLSMALGIFFVCCRLLASRGWSIFVCALWLFTGTSLSFLHQEQALATVGLVPWVWLCLLKAKTDSRYWVLAAALVGLSLNNHYPQLQFGYYGVIFLGSVVIRTTRKTFWREALLTLRPKWLVTGVLAAVAFLVSAGPVFYSYVEYHDKLVSPFRQQEDGVLAQSFEEYDRINRMGPSSLDPANLVLYAGFRGRTPPKEIGHLDELPLYCTFLATIGVVCLILFRIPYRGFQAFALVGLALLASGINGPAPRLLWNIMPAISMFRQWYHFTPLLSLHVLFLCGATMVFLYRRYDGWKRAATFGVAALSLVQAYLWTVPAHHRMKVELYPREGEIPLMEKAEVFARWVFFRSPTFSPLAVPKEMELEKLGEKISLDMPRWWALQPLGPRLQETDVVVTPRPSGFVFEFLDVPPGAMSIYWLQHQDGGWKVRLEHGELMRLPRTEPYLLQVPNEGRPYFLTRVPTLWRYLVVTMWLPALLGAGWVLLGIKKKRAEVTTPGPSENYAKPITGVAG